jgi:dihydrofolate reductase
MTLAADALLLGRITYEGMAQAWPTRGGNPFADHVNSITKYVVASQPVDTTAWDPTVVISGPDLLDDASRLRQAEGGDLLIWGTGQLTDALAAAGLLDEYRICACPVIKWGRRAPVSPRQRRHRRAPRHQDLCHRRRCPRVPSRLSP